MNELFCKISDARSKNPVKVIGLTALISGMLLLTVPVGICINDSINWPSYESEDMFGICLLITGTIGIFGLLVAFTMLLGQFMEISNDVTSKMEGGNRNQYRYKHYSGTGFGLGEMDEYERDTLECNMYHDSFMISQGQNPLDYGDWVDHTFDPFGFGDD